MISTAGDLGRTVAHPFRQHVAIFSSQKQLPHNSEKVYFNEKKKTIMITKHVNSMTVVTVVQSDTFTVDIGQPFFPRFFNENNFIVKF